MKKSYIGKIPFSKTWDGSRGCIKHYPSHFPHLIEWKDNFEFVCVLSLDSFGRGRSAAHLYGTIHNPEPVDDRDVFWLEDYEVVIFLKDFLEMIPILSSIERLEGVLYLEGKFSFCKRGENFGIAAIE